MRVPRLEPMLASTGAVRGSAGEWAFEPKFDGWRVAVTASPERLTIRTRNGRDVTASLPELGPLHGGLAGRSVVFDGELIAGAGTPAEFYRLAPRMSATRSRGRDRLTFVAFDVLYLDGELLTGRTYQDRRAVLESLLAGGPAWCVSPSYVGDGPELFAACVEHGVEGVVAKRLTSSYRPGKRSPDWVKVKCEDWRARQPRAPST